MTLATNVLLGVTCVTAAAVILAVYTRWGRQDQARLRITAGALNGRAALTLLGRF